VIDAFRGAGPGAGDLLDAADPLTGSPLSAGRRAWWLAVPGSDGGPKLYDLLGRAPGTLAGATWSGPRDPARPGTAPLTFDGTAAYVSLGSPPALNLPGALTIVAWFYPTAATGARGLVADLNAGGSASQFALEFGRTASRLDALANGGAIAVTGTRDVALNQWHHAVLTRSGSAGAWTYTLYLDGTLDASAAVSANPDAQQGAALGRLGALAGGNFAGSLDGASAWDRALPAAEVRALYEDARAGYPETLRRWGPAVALQAGGAAPAVLVPWPLFSQRSA
jgi:hypothetical protein